MSAHTPGPWQWEVTPGGEIRLATPDRGKLFVMGFERKGMRGAQPRFSLWGEGPRERRGGIMHGFIEAGGEMHPDARLIAAAPELLAVAVCEEALSKLCREGWPIIEQYGWDPSSGEGPTAYVARMRRAAIAKATGAQP